MFGSAYAAASYLKNKRFTKKVSKTEDLCPGCRPVDSGLGVPSVLASYSKNKRITEKERYQDQGHMLGVQTCGVRAQTLLVALKNIRITQRQRHHPNSNVGFTVQLLPVPAGVEWLRRMKVEHRMLV